MALTPGSLLGHYEITGHLGAGGMGVVHRARDRKLDRDVALKVLPDALTHDAERRARFEREAKTLASLNNPHIAAIYGIADADGVSALVMELVEGHTLAEHIKQGPIPVAESLRITRQIVEALEAAHEKNIVHRDLKPANIMLGIDGQVKVLDFGLAKTAVFDQSATSTAVLSLSPTMTSPVMLSMPGVILGTATYMSPEQAKGRETDKRSDVWAFGCILYEMLTGHRAFNGDDVSDVLAAVLRGDPDWSLLPPDVPDYVRTLLRRCLEKDRKARIPDISVVRYQLEEAATAERTDSQPRGSQAAPRLVNRERLMWLAALLTLTVAAAVIANRALGTPERSRDVLRFEIRPPQNGLFAGANSTPRMAISPDGQYLAFTTNMRDGKPDQLWIRRLDSFNATPLVTIEESTGEPVQQPFWSPDSRFVAFFVDGKLRKVDVRGGPAQTVCDIPGNNYGGTWSDDGTIVFGSSQTAGLQRVSASGGVPSQVTKLDASSMEMAHLWPDFLPDGKHFLYLVNGAAEGDRAIYVGSLDSPDRTLVLKASSMVKFVLPGELLFMRDGALMHQAFDTRAFTLRGEPALIVDGVQANLANGRAGFTVSQTGVIVYRVGNSARLTDSQLVWIDRNGRDLGTEGPASAYRGIELSPDDRRLVMHIDDGAGGGDLWIRDLERGSTTRLTLAAEAHNVAPTWSPNGRNIYFARRVDGGIYSIFRKDSGGVGDEHPVYEASKDSIPSGVSPDGKVLVFLEAAPGGGIDLKTIALPDGQAATTYAHVPPGSGQEAGYGELSPDGHWLAYTSRESSRSEVYVQSFPRPDVRYQVSTAGGRAPKWRGDGHEIVYATISSGGPVSIMSVAVEPSGVTLRLGRPQKLFESVSSILSHAIPFETYDMTSDGQRFLMTRPAGEPSLGSLDAPLSVIVNWNAAVRGE